LHMFITQWRHARWVQSAVFLLICLGLGVGVVAAQEATDPGKAMEQMLSRLAAQRAERSTAASQQILREADRIVNQSKAKGFAHALEQRIEQEAAELRKQLAAGQI